MAALIALCGVGGYVFGGTGGLVVMCLFGLAMNFGAYWFSDTLALRANRAQPVARHEAPALYAVIERLTARAGVPMPRVYVIPSASPNAFATGRGPNHAAVAVTEGLLELVDDRELEGVLGHELSHVVNRDILVATIAAGVAGVVSSIGYVLQFGMLFGGLGGGRDREDRGGSAFAALAWIVVAPLVAMLLQLAISRAREYGADSSGARLTGDPDALADALGKLEAWSRRKPYEYAGPATAHLFILNPLAGRSVLGWLSTHPPIEERIARLRAMSRRVERRAS